MELHHNILVTIVRFYSHHSRIEELTLFTLHHMNTSTGFLLRLQLQLTMFHCNLLWTNETEHPLQIWKHPFTQKSLSVADVTVVTSLDTGKQKCNLKLIAA